MLASSRNFSFTLNSTKRNLKLTTSFSDTVHDLQTSITPVSNIMSHLIDSRSLDCDNTVQSLSGTFAIAHSI
jgi:hypothetical protein